jgi:HK97 family phage major capsid protein
MLRKELDQLNKQLAELRAKAEGFTAREAELETAINEAETDEERSTVSEAVEAFENEREETNGEIAGLEERVSGIESELEALEDNQDPAPAPAADPEPKPENRERGFTIMNKRNIFRSMDVQTRDALFAREDVTNFLTQVRTAIKEKRAITGGGLLVPEVFLGLIRENIMEYSKLYKHVNLRQIGGNGTVVVMGTIPEAVWTDCCANLNELDLTFNDAEVACWRVGGYFDVCNATLEDSDIDLASELLTVLGQAIGLALDKAILFGLGTRMPLGVFTRLAQTAAPADYPATARPWADLHTSNIKSIAASVKGIDLFRAFLTDTAAAKGKYSRGEKVWVMNETTYTAIVAAGMSIDAGGAIVAGVNGQMPVIGGVIEVLDFVPDNVIIGGYFDLYLLAERAGTRLDQSEHVHFIQDRTVFRGTARYDGLPVIAEGFVAIGINGTTPSASGITFAPDTANAEESGS